VTTQLLHPVATATVATESAPISSGSITLDESWAPYGQGQIEIPMDAPDAVPIDPREGDRCQVVATVDGEWAGGVWTPGESRTFDLGIRSRVFDYGTRVCTLQLATDEALLQDYSVLAADDNPWGLQGSLRAVVNYVLGLVDGAALAADPATDANVTAYWQLTNMVPNPSVANSLGTFYTTGPGTSAVDYSTAVGGRFGTSAVRWTASGGAPSFLSARSYTARAGVTYTASAYVRLATTSRQFRVRFNYRDSENELISFSTGPSVFATTTDWSTRISHTAEAPAGTARIGLLIEAVGGPVAGQLFYGDGFMFYEGSRVVEYFDGTTTPAGYTTSWADATQASQSTRYPIRELDPGLLTWPAGTTAWDFLQPLLTAAALRLFCDEARVWRLVPAEYDVPDSVTLTGDSVTLASDAITRGDVSLWCEGVVARYTWTDPSSIPRQRIDAAGVPGRVLVVDYARPYPGPGAAAAILARMTARGREQVVTALTVPSVAPGMETRATLPSQGLITGRLRSVQFDLAIGLMALTARQQTQMAPGAWGAANPATRWDDVGAAVTWATYTP
jgi:hypothetical protein